MTNQFLEKGEGNWVCALGGLGGGYGEKIGFKRFK